MAGVRRSKSNWGSSVKILLISSCVVSIAVVLKLFVPLLMEFAVHEAPVIWKSVASWLKPPYLYIVINFIIITIAATSQLCHKHDEQNQVHNDSVVLNGDVSSEFVVYEAKKIETDNFSDFSYEMKLPPVTVANTSGYYVTETAPVANTSGYYVTETAPVANTSDYYVTETAPVANTSDYYVTETAPVATSPDFYVFQTPVQNSPDFSVMKTPEIVLEPIEISGGVEEVKTVVDEIVAKVEDEEEFVISRSNWSPVKRMNSSEFSSENLPSSSEKPLVSSRFSHRKPVKSSPEGGKALRVTKAKRQDTFESTWKAITDGRHIPLTRHRKSDTWENHNRPINMVSSQQDDHKNMMKSETFKDRTNDQIPPLPVRLSPSSGQLRREPSLSGKLRKEPSLSQDDLNRRVEAFIKKFNEDMRLQRQESLNQYNEMINRGAY